jgi:lantibiotic biosynthesis protein
MTTEAIDSHDLEQARAQSLASGTAGAALLDVERALTGSGTWATATERIRTATAAPISAADHVSLYYGIPSICFLLHAASADGSARYRTAAKVADQHVIAVAERRIRTAAKARADGAPLTFKEYDLFYGLIGLSSLIVRHLPEAAVLPDALSYLVQLAALRRADGLVVPGWWVEHDPDPIMPTPGGHANLGMAHGAAGLLAVLALSSSRGIEVPGQREAIESIFDLFDQWRQDGPHGPWWPQWLTREDLHSGRPSQPAPGRISWCYGAPGITRAQQLAALALDDSERQARAERDLAANLTEIQFQQITDPGLCHGTAGIFQTAWRAARDARSPEIAAQLPEVATWLTRPSAGAPDDTGLLTGKTGLALALETLHRDSPPRSGWDECLLIN